MINVHRATLEQLTNQIADGIAGAAVCGRIGRTGARGPTGARRGSGITNRLNCISADADTLMAQTETGRDRQADVLVA